VRVSRIVLALVVAFVLVVVLFTLVFPVVDRMLVTNPILGEI